MPAPKRKKAKPQLLKKIVDRRPKQGEATLFGQDQASLIPGMTNKDIARINAGMEVSTTNPLEVGELGFSTRVLVQATLPHSKPPKDQDVWIRRNGHATLTIQSGYSNQNGEREVVGLPYGTIPRLIMIYLCSEAKRLNSPEIDLGGSLSDFMAELGLKRTGGKRGDITRLKEQVNRLVRSRLEYEYNDGHTSAGFQSQVASQWFFFWDPNPNQTTMFKNKVVLSGDFFNEIVKNPVPLHLGAVAALKNSPFDLDLYTWLTYRVATLKKPAFIQWPELQNQLGASYNSTSNFARHARERLQNVQTVWHGLEFEKRRGGFLLKPSEPSVPRLSKKKTSKE